MQGTGGPSFFLEEGMKVAFVPPLLNAPRSGVVQSLQHLKGDTYLVFFDSIDNIDQAEAFVGSYCLVAKSDLPEEIIVEVCDDLLGFTVVDAAFGPIGLITEVIEGPAQALLKIQGDTEEILVPYVDEFIKQIDHESQKVNTVMPQGLLDLAVPFVDKEGTV